MKADHIVILVSDFDAGLSHYAALLPVLGFRKTADHVWAGPDGFAIGVQPATEQGTFRRHAPGLHHVALSVDSDAELDEIARRMTEADLCVPEFDRFGTARSLWIENPDSLQLEVTYDPARPY